MAYRILKATTTVATMIILLCACIVATGYAGAQEEKHPLLVNYADNTAQPYTVFVDPGNTYTLSQSHSWVRDEMSRYSLVSYSIDDSAYVEISRKARGSLLLDVPTDSGHTVTFQAVVQYPVSVLTDSEGLEIAFSPPSPTDDDWFDVGSDVTITISTKERDVTRQQLVSWSLDKSTKRFVSSDGPASFSIPVIKVNAPHKIELNSKTQYYIDIITEHGTVTGKGWYDSGSTASVGISHTDELLIRHVFAGWEDGSGMQFQDNSMSFVVDSPRTLTANLTTDYSQLAGVVVAPAIAAGVVIMLKKRSSKATGKASSVMAAASETSGFQQQVATSTPLIALQEHETDRLDVVDDNSSYSKEIMEYALQKSVVKLEALRSSGLVSDDRFSKIKEKIQQTFD